MTATLIATAALPPEPGPGVPARRATIGRAVRAILARDLRVLRRGLVVLFARVVLQPLLFVFVFAYVMPQLAGNSALLARGGLSYATILVPGLIGTALLTQGLLAVVLPLVVELSYQHSIDERALAPVPIAVLALEKIASAALQSVLAGLLVVPAVLLVHAPGQGPHVHVANWPLLVVIVLSAATLAAATGMLLATVIDAGQSQALFALTLLPMTMLGSVYYPWSALRPLHWLQVAVLANPMTYVSEGLRAALTPTVGHLDPAVTVTVLVTATITLTVLATRTFTRRVIR